MTAQVTTLRSVRSSGSALRSTAPARSTSLRPADSAEGRALPTAPIEAAVTSIASAPTPVKDASRADLVRLNETTWRVCDSHGTPGERGYIVGYLQLVEDEFEMLWMHPRPGVVQRHTSFEDAERAIAVRMRMFAK
jgi:hypothetical protein